MKKIKKHPVFFAAIALFVAMCVINADVAAVLLVFYLFAGMFWLLAKSIQVAKKKCARPAKKPQKAEGVQQPKKQENQPAPEPQPQRPRLPFTHNGLERRYHYEDVGIYLPNPQAMTLPGLDVGATVTLWQEKQNQYDAKAVAVVFGGYIIGYLYRGRLQDMANDWLNKGMPVLSVVYSKTAEGLQLGLAFYDLPKLQRYLQNNPNPKMYRLTRTGSNAAQEALGLCIDGVELDLEEDDDGNYVAAFAGNVVGYLPARAIELVDDYGGPDMCSIFMAKTELDDNLKTKASIYIFRGH